MKSPTRRLPPHSSSSTATPPPPAEPTIDSTARFLLSLNASDNLSHASADTNAIRRRSLYLSDSSR